MTIITGLGRRAALFAMLIAATLFVSCGSPDVRTTPRTTPQTGREMPAPPASANATEPQTTVGPTDSPPGPLAMGLTECPPSGRADAAGYAATAARHPAVVVMPWALNGTKQFPYWISYDSPDPLFYNRVDGTAETLQVPVTWLATDVSELQLIICVETTSVRGTRLETCDYVGSGGIEFTIYRGDIAVSAYDARTGAKVGVRMIEEQAPGGCPFFWDGHQSTARGVPPAVARVREAIEYLVTQR